MAASEGEQRNGERGVQPTFPPEPLHHPARRHGAPFAGGTRTSSKSPLNVASGREGAATDENLGVLVEFLARMLSLPLDREGVRNILGNGSTRRQYHSYADK